MGWKPFKRDPAPAKLSGVTLLDAVLASACDEEQLGTTMTARWHDVVAVTVSDARREIGSAAFGNAGVFTQAFGTSLAQAVAIHVASIVTSTRKKDPNVEEHSELVFDRWNIASDGAIRDLAAILAWRHALASFNDVNNIFPEGKREAGYQRLMVICGTLFPASERATRLIKAYDECLTGAFASLGGGLLRDGGTYWIHSDNALMTTHPWMVNAALDGPPLDMNVIDPAGVFYVQTLLINYLIEFTKAYRQAAMDYLN